MMSIITLSFQEIGLQTYAHKAVLEVLSNLSPTHDCTTSPLQPPPPPNLKKTTTNEPKKYKWKEAHQTHLFQHQFKFHQDKFMFKIN